MAKGTVIVNRGQRTYHLVKGPAGESRSIPPGGSIEVADEQEAKLLLRYHDLRDVKDVAPETARQIKAHEAEIERLEAENKRLKEAASRAGTGDSIEELAGEDAGTGFEGPGGPAVAVGRPNPETEPTRQETTDSEEAQEKAERAERGSVKHQRRGR